MYDQSYRPGFQSSLFPPVIKNLLIINGLVFLAQIAPSSPLGSILQQWFALWPIGGPDVVRFNSGGAMQVHDFWPWQVVTYGFLHGGGYHLLGNMFGLWMFGKTLEEVWGAQRFTVFYFVCVIGGALLQLVSTFGGYVPTVGASAGVMGVLLAFGMMFPNQEIMIIPIPIPIKAKWVVLAYGFFTISSAFGGRQDGIAHMAHLGGLVFGFLLIQYWRGKLPIKPRERMYY